MLAAGEPPPQPRAAMCQRRFARLPQREQPVRRVLACREVVGAEPLDEFRDLRRRRVLGGRRDRQKEKRREEQDAFHAGSLAPGRAAASLENPRPSTANATVETWAGRLHRCYPEFTLEWLLTEPFMSSGVFALRADAPHWAAWEQRPRPERDDGESQPAL